MSRLSIAINAQLLPDSGTGGVQTYLTGLVKALGELDGPERYVLVGPWEEPDWLKPYIGQNQRIVRGPKIDALKRALRPIKPMIKTMRRATAWIANAEGASPRVPESNGFYERLGCDVIHFPYQNYVASKIPAVYNPHDLQHLHYPEFFPKADIEWREVTYRAACRAAHTVVVHSDWVKKDIVRQYDIEPDKIQVILTPPPIQVHSEPTTEILDSVSRTYQLPDRFTLYPAMTWEHKNHIRLLEALALLRDRQTTRVELICTGWQTDFFPQIRRRLKDLRLDGQVRFLGMVPAEHLRALYRLAEFTVLPTLFEGAGLPLVEAWKEGCPVTCSAVTSLLELGGDAAILFDPHSVESIAQAVAKMAGDPSLRQILARHGFARLENFKWETAARAYRDIYRTAAGYSSYLEGAVDALPHVG